MAVFTEGWAMMIPWGRIESTVYWLTFVAGFIVVAIWESRRPQRNLSSAVTRRWSRHGIILYANMLVSVGLYRVSPVIVAVAMSHSRFGLLNKPWLPYPVRFIFALLLLDLARYGVHWSYHAVPFLWRFHYVHHSDPDFDLSSGVRAHPIEVALTQGSNLAAVAILAAPPAAALAAELFSCAQGFFSHANASLQRGWKNRFVGCLSPRTCITFIIQKKSRNSRGISGKSFPGGTIFSRPI